MAYKGGKRARAVLKYEPIEYTVIGTELTDKQLRVEYSRLRSIARKRLERMSKTEWNESQTFLYNNGRFKPLKEMKNEREMRYLLQDVSRFIKSDTGSVKLLKEDRVRKIETLKEHGYTGIDNKNFKKFGDFMEYARNSKTDKIRSSTQLADFFDKLDARRVDNEDLMKAFDKWTKRQEKLDKIQNKKLRNGKQYRQAYRQAKE